MKKLEIAIVLIMLLAVALNVRGQAYYGNSTDAIELCKAFQGNQFGNSIEANAAIEEILSVIGAKNRFVVQPCDNINNALAITIQGIRYIFYNPVFMNSISSGSYSSNLFILAHEIGHHINGHTQDIIMLLSDHAPASSTLAEERIEELEADEFAGFIMGKLGYSLVSMQNSLRNCADDSDDSYSTHPKLSKRLIAVETGYNSARESQELKTNVSPNKQTAEEYFYRGLSKYELGDYNGAIQDYNKAIQLAPDNTSAYINRGNSKSNLGDENGAIQDYNKAIQLAPDDALAYYNRGISKSNLGDENGAIQDYNKAIQLAPDDALAYINRGNSKGKLGDYNGSIQDYNKAIQLAPDNTSVYINRGISKSNLGDYNGACLDWSKAGELGAPRAYELIREYCN